MELHSCRLCTFKSYYLNTLNLHLQRHQTERPFLCDECGKRFKAEKSLKAHLRTACAGAGGGDGATVPLRRVRKEVQGGEKSQGAPQDGMCGRRRRGRSDRSSATSAERGSRRRKVSRRTSGRHV